MGQKRGRVWSALGSAVVLSREPARGLAAVDTFQLSFLQHSRRPAASDAILEITGYSGNLSSLQVY